MTESERTEELRKISLDLAIYNADKMSREDFDVEQLVNTYKSRAKEIIKPLAEKFGVFKNYRNEQVDLEFQYSKSSFEESLYKQNERTKGFDSFAKMLSCFDEVVENAQPVYIHDDRYRGTRRKDPQIKQVYVLVSAYRDTDSSIVPAELLIKEYRNIKNKLYVSVTMNKIEETSLMGQAELSEGENSKYPKLVPYEADLYGQPELSKGENSNNSKSASLETSLEAQTSFSKREDGNNAKLVSSITLPELFSKINPK